MIRQRPDLERRLVRPRSSEPPPIGPTSADAIVEYLTTVLYGEEDAVWARQLYQDVPRHSNKFDIQPPISLLPWNFQWRLWLLWQRQEQCFTEGSHYEDASLLISSWLMSILVQAQLDATNLDNETRNASSLDWVDHPSLMTTATVVADITATQDPMIRCWTHGQRRLVTSDIQILDRRLPSSDQSCLLELVQVLDDIAGYSDQSGEPTNLLTVTTEFSTPTVVSQLYRLLYLHSQTSNRRHPDVSEEQQQQQQRLRKLCRFLARQGGSGSKEFQQLQAALWQTAADNNNRSILSATPSSYHSFVLERFMSLIATVDPDKDDQATVQGRALLWYLLNRRQPVDNEQSFMTTTPIINDSGASTDEHLIAIERLNIDNVIKDAFTPSILRQVVHGYLVATPLTTRMIPDVEALVMQLWNIMTSSTAAKSYSKVRAVVLAVLEEFQSWLPLPATLLQQYRTMVLKICWGNLRTIPDSTTSRGFPWQAENTSQQLAVANHRTDTANKEDSESQVPSDTLVRALTKAVWLLFNPLERSSFWQELLHEDDATMKTKLLHFGFEAGLLISRLSLAKESSATALLPNGGDQCFLQAVSCFCAILEGITDDEESCLTCFTTIPALSFVLDILTSDSLLLFDIEVKSNVADTAKELHQRIIRVLPSIPKARLSNSAVVESLVAFCQEYPCQILDASGWPSRVVGCLKNYDTEKDTLAPIWISKLLEYCIQHGVPTFSVLLKRVHSCIVQQFYSVEKGNPCGHCLLETLLTQANGTAKPVGEIIRMTVPECLFSGCQMEEVSRILSSTLGSWPLTDAASTDYWASTLLALALHLDNDAMNTATSSHRGSSLRNLLQAQNQCRAVVRKFLLREFRLVTSEGLRNWDRIHHHVTHNLEKYNGTGMHSWKAIVLDFAQLGRPGTGSQCTPIQIATSDFQIFKLLEDTKGASVVKRTATGTIRDERRKRLAATRLAAAASSTCLKVDAGYVPTIAKPPDTLASTSNRESTGAEESTTTSLGQHSTSNSIAADNDADQQFILQADDSHKPSGTESEASDDEILLLDL